MRSFAALVSVVVLSNFRTVGSPVGRPIRALGSVGSLFLASRDLGVPPIAAPVRALPLSLGHWTKRKPPWNRTHKLPARTDNRRKSLKTKDLGASTL